VAAIQLGEECVRLAGGDPLGRNRIGKRSSKLVDPLTLLLEVGARRGQPCDWIETARENGRTVPSDPEMPHPRLRCERGTEVYFAVFGGRVDLAWPTRLKRIVTGHPGYPGDHAQFGRVKEGLHRLAHVSAGLASLRRQAQGDQREPPRLLDIASVAMPASGGELRVRADIMLKARSDRSIAAGARPLTMNTRRDCRFASGQAVICLGGWTRC